MSTLATEDTFSSLCPDDPITIHGQVDRVRTVYFMRIIDLGCLGDWKASAEHRSGTHPGLCLVLKNIYLGSPPLQVAKDNRISGAHLSIFSRISAMLVSGLQRLPLRLRCSRGRQVFH